jgi:outer membrane protein assembly factor BamB
MAGRVTRRRALAGGAAAGALGVGWWLLAGRESTITGLDPTPMYQQDAANTGRNATDGPAVRSLEERWTVTHDRPVISTPTVADGEVYVTTYRGDIHAYDAASGERVWETERTRTRVVLEGTAPAVVDDRLYLAAGNAVLGLDRADGSVRWSTELDGNTQTAVTYRDGTIYIGTNGGTIHALAEDGTERWRLNPPEVSRVSAPVAVADGTVYATARSTAETTQVLALDGAAGEVVWRYDCGPQTGYGAPTVTSDTVYACVRGRGVFALRRGADTDERLRWRGESNRSASGSSLAVADGTVVANTANMVAFDAETGEQRWTVESRHSGGFNSLTGAPTVVNGTVVGSTGGDALYVIDLESGQRRATVTTAGDIHAPIGVGEGAVFFGADETLHAMDLRG